jgi:hypothetical protein
MVKSQLSLDQSLSLASGIWLLSPIPKLPPPVTASLWPHLPASRHFILIGILHQALLLFTSSSLALLADVPAHMLRARCQVRLHTQSVLSASLSPFSSSLASSLASSLPL